MTQSLQWNNHFYNTFSEYEGLFLTPCVPFKLPKTQIVAWSDACADTLDIGRGDCNWLGLMRGSSIPIEANPCATVYSGHQFGRWAGQLGDGRAMLIGGIHTPQGDFELQLKGSGPTAYSRQGDGFAVLRSSIREFLCSEAMAGLGIPTTRALALASSGQPVLREGLETAAVVLRVAPSFIRFGHIEHFAANNQPDALKKLIDFVIEHYYPTVATIPIHSENENSESRTIAFFDEVCQRTATLMVQWQAVGFCHGVMNTDNMSILGLTIDYGPFGFLDTFNAKHVCNHSDSEGRYAYSKQPKMAYWNLSCLAYALSNIVQDQDALNKCLKRYTETFNRLHTIAFLHKLGLPETLYHGDEFVLNTLKTLHEAQADMTLFFRSLSKCVAIGDFAEVKAMCKNPCESLEAWFIAYETACNSDGLLPIRRSNAMLGTNPKYILRNHLAEIAIKKARDDQDYSDIHILKKLLASPFEEHPEYEDSHATLPPDWALDLCVSCSS